MTAIQFGPYSFKTQQEAKEYSRNILFKYPKPFSILAEEDANFYIMAWEAHPEVYYRAIVAQGIVKIYTYPVVSQYDPNRVNHIGLQAQCKNGTRIGVAYSNMFNNWGNRARIPKSLKVFKQACRVAVLEDIAPLSGFGKRVHHDGVSFDKIIADFIEKEEINVETIEYVHKANHSPEFSDDAIRIRFREYHLEVANLVSLSIEEHNLAHHTRGVGT